MGFEPTTPTLARLCSTPELHPRPRRVVRPSAWLGMTEPPSSYAKERIPLQLRRAAVTEARRFNDNTTMTSTFSRRKKFVLRRLDHNYARYVKSRPPTCASRRRNSDHGRFL